MKKKKDNVINFPSTPSKLERQVEAILFAAAEPLDIETIEKRLQTQTNIKKTLGSVHLPSVVKTKVFREPFLNKI